MKYYQLIAAAAAALPVSATAAAADCQDELTQLGISKDGSVAPMQADPSVATSAQDTEAQTEGDETAAEQAAGGAGGADKAAAMERAQAALAAGDEPGCMKAVNEAEGLRARAREKATTNASR